MPTKVALNDQQQKQRQRLIEHVDLEFSLLMITGAYGQPPTPLKIEHSWDTCMDLFMVHNLIEQLYFFFKAMPGIHEHFRAFKPSSDDWHPFNPSRLLSNIKDFAKKHQLMSPEPELVFRKIVDPSTPMLNNTTAANVSDPTTVATRKRKRFASEIDNHWVIQHMPDALHNLKKWLSAERPISDLQLALAVEEYLEGPSAVDDVSVAFNDRELLVLSQPGSSRFRNLADADDQEDTLDDSYSDSTSD